MWVTQIGCYKNLVGRVRNMWECFSSCEIRETFELHCIALWVNRLTRIMRYDINSFQESMASKGNTLPSGGEIHIKGEGGKHREGHKTEVVE